jgi:polyphosphate glucokinase
MIVLGIDIGGTGVKGALVDTETGAVKTDRFRLPTPQPAIPSGVAGVVESIAKHFDYRGSAGITFPGVIKKGVIQTAANLDGAWIGRDGAELFRPCIGGEVVVLNDADAAGLAEMRFGCGVGQGGTVVLVTLGTGIGSAVFYDGKLLPNTEFGHLKIRGKDAEKRASERVREHKGLSWEEWSERVAEFLRELEHLLAPDLFIIGGGISKKADKFLPLVARSVQTRMEPARLLNNAGIIGAALVAP